MQSISQLLPFVHYIHINGYNELIINELFLIIHFFEHRFIFLLGSVYILLTDIQY